ncbi:MAG: hypothetical protein IT366_08645 [Candidatus Hydrogenedentes bacterium]|nr:hypothetical protein [Candidatus Hydrogenedentota bacterium]
MNDSSTRNKLVVKSEHSPQVLAEYVTLCTQGRIFNDYRIESYERELLFHFVQLEGACELVAAGDDIDWEPDGALLELANVYLGLRLIQATVEVQGPWESQLPDDLFVTKNVTPKKIIGDVNQSVTKEVCLSLANLAEIGARLFSEKRSAPDLSIDAKFREVFPGIEMKWGSYGFIRHRSGTEVRTCWEDKTHELISHGFESPSPSEQLARKWLKTKGVEFGQSDFSKYRKKKWRLATLLNRVPQQYKRRVYEWVITTHFDVEEFHSTRGGFPIPERFELEFGKSMIFCGRDLEFELIEG